MRADFEERAALLQARAETEAEKADKIRERSDIMMARADKMRGGANTQNPSTANDTETKPEE